MDCVQNTDPRRRLNIKWYGSAFLETSVPKGAVLQSERRETVVRGQVNQYYSCVLAGGAWTTDAYIVDTHPLPPSTFAADPDCVPPRAATSTVTPSGPLPSLRAPPEPMKAVPVKFTLHAFFATNSARPDDSMLEATATGSFEKSSFRSYVPVVNYVVQRFDDARLGRLDQVRIRVLFPGPAEAARQFYDRSYPDGIAGPFGKPGPVTRLIKGVIDFPVVSDNGWHLASAVLQFTNLDHQQLVAVLLPLLVPGG